ncbi:MAG: low molecular weight protein-tyrosine-phosphatase [Arenicellales bacterium]
MATHSILFVCLGNICRSPTAEGVFRQFLSKRNLLEQFEVDSAGTGNWHIGSPPDKRAQLAASTRGIDISSLRARQISDADIHRFDYIIAMDHSNQRELVALAGQARAHKIRLLLEFTEIIGLDEVPDPYYGGDRGFDQVLDMIEEASEGLITHILKQ